MGLKDAGEQVRVFGMTATNQSNSHSRISKLVLINLIQSLFFPCPHHESTYEETPLILNLGTRQR